MLLIKNKDWTVSIRFEFFNFSYILFILPIYSTDVLLRLIKVLVF